MRKKKKKGTVANDAVNPAGTAKYYIGLSLASNSSTDSGIVVIDEENNLVAVEKLYKMDEITVFFNKFEHLQNSHLCISLPWDKTMLDGKWRILGKPYQLVMSNEKIPNRNNWTQRYAARGADYFKGKCSGQSAEGGGEGCTVNRFELYLTRQSMRLSSGFKERSPADCKFLQQTLKIEHGLDLPTNMMPMSQLEAMVGALLARENARGKTRIIGQFKDLPIIDVISE